jgi:hypothetical protein
MSRRTSACLGWFPLIIYRDHLPRDDPADLEKKDVDQRRLPQSECLVEVKTHASRSSIIVKDGH